MKLKLRRFLDDKRGATAIEYALIATLLSVALIGGATSIGNAINSSMDSTSQHLKDSQ